MDPLSITAGCIGLVETIGKLSLTITLFVRDVRTARIDLDAISRELLSLKTVLELLEEDVTGTQNTSIPDTLSKQITGIISNCNAVVEEIQTTLDKHAGNRIDKTTKWALFGKNDVNKLRLSLEAHKSALDIALDMLTLTIAKRTERNTEELLDNTGAIKQDTETILDKIAQLMLLLPKQSQGASSSLTLERYLDDFSNYAETIVDSTGLDSDGESDRASQSLPQSPTKDVSDDKNKRTDLNQPKAGRQKEISQPEVPHGTEADQNVTPLDKLASHSVITLARESSDSKLQYTFRWEHPGASEVFVTGTFDDWGKTQKLEKFGPHGFFQKTVRMPEEGKFLYKFVVDGEWVTNPHLPKDEDTMGLQNNVGYLSRRPRISDLHTEEEPFNYTFMWEYSGARKVYVTGTFDDWGKTQRLEKFGPDGFFRKTVTLPSSGRFLYNFVVDGHWMTDPHLLYERDPSGYSGPDHNIGFLQPDPLTSKSVQAHTVFDYTFRWQHPGAQEVFVTGTFDDWSKVEKLDKIKSTGFFEKRITLPEHKCLYKFVVDGSWTTNDDLPFEDDSSSNRNNVIFEEDLARRVEFRVIE